MFPYSLCQNIMDKYRGLRQPTSDIALRIDGRAASKHIALWNIMHTICQMRLRHRLVVGHVFAAIDQLKNTRWHV